jgi:hypothetical protein
MQTPLELFEAQLDLITDVCVDPWFREQLALSRSGDEQARRRISGSCLRLVLNTARRWSPESPLSLLGLAEDGNRILMKTVKQFHGSTAAEFLQELIQNLESEYSRLLGPPVG